MFRERVWPPVTWFLIALLVVPAVILALAPINLTLGIVMSVIVYLGCVAFLVVQSPVNSVDDAEFRAGKGRIERKYLGAAVAVRDDAFFDELHSKLDARAWLSLRSWVRGLVKVELTDPDDPTPYWLVSSRSPAALVAALNSGHEKTADQK
ncbi:MAG: DUF3093 domain-containing protein [Agromyces sp.]